MNLRRYLAFMLVPLLLGAAPVVHADELSAVEVGSAVVSSAAETGSPGGEAEPATESAAAPLLEIPELDLSQRMVITLEEALGIVTAQSYRADLARAEWERSRFDLDLAVAPFDPLLRVSSGYRSTESHGASALIASNSVSSSESTFYSIDLDRRFPSGDTFSVRHELSRSEMSQTGTGGTQTIPRSYSGSLGVSWTHPLARGQGRDATWAQVRQTLNRRSADDAALEESVRQLRFETYSLYYALVAQRRALEVRKANLESAIHLLRRNSERHKVGLAIRADVLEAENNVLNQKTRMIEDQRKYLDSLDQLALLLGVHQLLDIDPAVSLAEPQLSMEMQSGWPRVKEASASLRQAEADLRKAEIGLAFYETETRPDLSLTLDYARQGEDASAGAALRNLDDETYSVVLNYTLPWGKRAHKARLAQAQQDLRAAQARFSQVSQQLQQEWEAQFREAESKRVQLDLAESNVVVARENYDIQVERNKLGLATTYDVVRAQEALLEAELALLYAQVDYNTVCLRILTMAGDI